MRLIIQYLDEIISYQKHTKYILETYKVKDAINYALKKELGRDIKLDDYQIKELKHHGANLFAIVNIEYTTREQEIKKMISNGVEKEYKGLFVPKSAMTKVRIEILEDKNKDKITSFKKFITNLKFKMRN